MPEEFIYDPKQLQLYEETLNKVQPKKGLRLISERLLTVDWQGLEDLIVFDIGPQSVRKLEGFVAAGGRVVHAKDPFHLKNEIPLNQFYKALEI